MVVTPTALPTVALDSAGNPLVMDSLENMMPLTNCYVESELILNLRERPAGAVKQWFNGIAAAAARTPNWFLVAYDGEAGWVSADYVRKIGDCG